MLGDTSADQKRRPSACFAARLRLGGYFATFNRDITDNDFELLAMRLASIGDRFERATERTL